MKRRIFGTVAKYLIGAGLLGYVVWANWKGGEPDGLAAVWQRHVLERQPIHWLPFAAAAAILLGSVLLTFVRWYLLVRAQGLPFTLRQAVRLGLVGYYFNTYLPGSVGGDVIKAVFITREQSRRTVAVATVIIDRVVGLWGLCWLVALLGAGFWAIGALEGPFRARLESITLTSWAIVGVSILVWGLLGLLPERRAQRFSQRLENMRMRGVGHAAAELWRAFWMYRVKWASIGVALVLSLVGHVGFVCTFYCAARTLHTADQIPTLATHFLIVPIGLAAQAGIITPGGVGGGELIFGGLYALVGFNKTFGVLGSLTQRVISWILGLVGYLVYHRLQPSIRSLPDVSAGPGAPPPDPSARPTALDSPPAAVNGHPNFRDNSAPLSPLAVPGTSAAPRQPGGLG